MRSLEHFLTSRNTSSFYWHVVWPSFGNYSAGQGTFSYSAVHAFLDGSGVGPSFWESPAIPHWGRIGGQARRGSSCASLSAPFLRITSVVWSFWATIEYPVVRVDLAGEVVPFPVPVNTCLQQHWKEWEEIEAGEWVLKTLHYGYALHFLCPSTLLARPSELSYGERSNHCVALNSAVQEFLCKRAIELWDTS